MKASMAATDQGRRHRDCQAFAAMPRSHQPRRKATRPSTIAIGLTRKGGRHLAIERRQGAATDQQGWQTMGEGQGRRQRRRAKAAAALGAKPRPPPTKEEGKRPPTAALSNARTPYMLPCQRTLQTMTITQFSTALAAPESDRTHTHIRTAI